MSTRLLIADSEIERLSLKWRFFRAAGFEVFVARGGVECLESLRLMPPHALVLAADLFWGGGDGVLTVLEEDRGIPIIPVVLLGAAEDTQHRWHRFNRVAGVYAEPIRLAVVLRTILSAIHNRRVHRFDRMHSL